MLDEGLGRGYPSITRIDGGHVGIVYEGSRADLVFEVLSLDELLTESQRVSDRRDLSEEQIAQIKRAMNELKIVGPRRRPK